ncbi:hypothetical protein N7494_004573 [Penicillium frequentans]|uniref:Uncharacterized protein n=1 Tax=Penicillium frequentans TaxID=3151616 RepID=A0AAD6GJ17_9EURO|nr:hypothetical protein N7494_004573 [Penicillium glabrum]
MIVNCVNADTGEPSPMISAKGSAKNGRLGKLQKGANAGIANLTHPNAVITAGNMTNTTDLGLGQFHVHIDASLLIMDQAMRTRNV